MKKIIMFLVVFCISLGYGKVQAQSEELQQLVLNIEKLTQFKQILSDMRKGYEILNGGYNTVRNLSEGNFSLHETFLDGLMKVSPTVKNYKKVADIIRFQQIILKECKTAFTRFKSTDLMSAPELDYISGVYSSLVKKSLENLEDLTMVLTAGKLRMSDDERIEAIDRIYDEMQEKTTFLRSFNNNTSVLVLQREKEQKDTRAMKAIYGIKQ